MLPNLIIIGAAKAGTTSLHYYLDLHPQIRMSQPKELNFFVEERNWTLGLDWYRSKFSGAEKIHGEASPAYTGAPAHPGVAERMHGVVPDARLIYVVRDPVSRMISHYVQRVAGWLEEGDIRDALVAPGANPYIDGTRYAMQLKQYLEYYAVKQIMVITCEDLLANRAETLRSVFQFLEVDETFRSLRFARMRHRAIRKRKPGSFGLRLRKSILQSRLYTWSPDLAHYAEAIATLPFSRAVQVPELTEEVRRDVLDRLKDDLDEFKVITGRQFDAWRLT
ncbi:MAG: sulfotransferase [Verrucomicrobia bacterium]|nr:sulfotransferase [Verrucomicrobiota bacterium]MDA1086132.1 sulfotransferase [Verrucomicrobiota bacterium]